MALFRSGRLNGAATHHSRQTRRIQRETFICYIGLPTQNSNMLLWILISVLIVTGWGGIIGLSFDYVYEHCHAANVQLAMDNRQGPPQDCQ